MLAPQELIGQKVWLNVKTDLDPESEAYRVKAEVTQPTAPPWFYARYLEAPAPVKTPGQWMTLYEVQLAVLQDPVIEEVDCPEDTYEDELDLI